LDSSRSPGGSSGGSAVAVAAGEAAFALASDTGGSARLPASFCGLVAMKPTYGLISRYGLVEMASSMDTVSPMTRTVEENRLILSVLAGGDPRDMTTVALSPSWFEDLERDEIGEQKKPLRVGFVQSFADLCYESVAKATHKAARIFIENHAVVETVEMPSPEKALAVYVILTAAEVSSNLARYDGIRFGCGSEGENFRDIYVQARTSGFGEEVTRRMLTGAYALASAHGGAYFHTIKGVQKELCSQVEDLLEQYDVLLMPTAATTAPLLSAQEKADQAYDSDQFTVYANLTGLPAIQIPFGEDGGMPIGVSLLGKRFGEPTLYRAAALLEAYSVAHTKEGTNGGI